MKQASTEPLMLATIVASIMIITSSCGSESNLEDETQAVCGNGSIEPGESCDGGNLDGRTCSDYPSFGELAGGELQCNAACTVNVASCKACWTYPCGPYGANSTPGTLIENISFQPANDPAKAMVGDNETFDLSDLFMLNEEHGGTLKGVLFFQTAGWCPYCSDEARFLNTQYLKYKDAGIILVGIVADDQGYNPATPDYAAGYAGRYGWTFPAVAGRIPAQFDPSGGESMPLNLYVDLTDMTIFSAMSGAPQEWQLDLELRGLSERAGH